MTNTIKEACPLGLKGCAQDPARIKAEWPEWFAQRYNGMTCEEVAKKTCRPEEIWCRQYVEAKES